MQQFLHERIQNKVYQVIINHLTTKFQTFNLFNYGVWHIQIRIEDSIMIFGDLQNNLT